MMQLVGNLVVKEDSMNNIFIKNLAALNVKNPKLAQALQNYVPSELPKLINDNGTHNFLYRGKFIHNKQSPLGEAKEIFFSADNSPVSIHLIYGLGLGYLFQVATNNSLGAVILYEPDLNILWTAFTLVDFTQDILKDNVYIASDFDTVSEYVHKKSGIVNAPVLLSLPSQREYNLKGFDELVKDLRDMVGTYALNLKFTKKKFVKSLVFLIKNIKSLKNEIPLNYYKDALLGKTAVVVSAGPTLDRNLEALKKYRDRYVLFAVGTSVKTLYKYGLRPDFLCLIETYDSSPQLEGLDLSKVNFITEPYSHPNLRKFKFKKIFSHISSNMPVNNFWAQICEERIGEYWSKGTVSYTALNSARLLGCSKIILVGQDLAYIEGQCYSKDSVYKDLTCEFNKESNKWEIAVKDFQKFASAISTAESAYEREKVARRRLENLNNSLYYVKGVNGDMIPTESVYAAFVSPLSDYTEVYSDRKYINTSMVGAQIDGFENMSLEKALANSESVGKLTLNEKVDFNNEKFEVNLRKKLDEMLQVRSLLSEGNSALKSLKNDLLRSKTVDAELLKKLKKVSMNYLVISNDFANKSKLFEILVASEKSEIDYEIKMITQITYEAVLNLTEKLTVFYNKIETRVNNIEGLINESFDTESEESICND